jgi:Family of unknown function (DUF5908)
MTIEVRQLHIRSTVVDPAANPAARPLDGNAVERQKREIIAELKAWLDARQRYQQER